MDEIVKIIQTVGFPIAVTIFLLVKYDKRFVEMSKVLGDININLTKINEHLEKHD